MLSSLQIPIGTGLCGWVAQNCKPILNGNPAVEHGFVHQDPRSVTGSRSALVVPLEGMTGLVGVLALYQAAAGCLYRATICASASHYIARSRTSSKTQ